MRVIACGKTKKGRSKSKEQSESDEPRRGRTQSPVHPSPISLSRGVCSYYPATHFHPLTERSASDYLRVCSSADFFSPLRSAISEANGTTKRKRQQKSAVNHFRKERCISFFFFHYLHPHLTHISFLLFLLLLLLLLFVKPLVSTNTSYLSFFKISGFCFGGSY